MDLSEELPGLETEVVTVRCISLWQPWASLMATIAAGRELPAKFVETRHWPTNIRGRVCIHASQTKQGINDCYGIPVPHIVAMEEALGMEIERWRYDLPFGAIVAVGDLVECLRSNVALLRYPDQEPFGNFSPGRFGHVYQNLRKIGPHPCKGLQGFFNAAVPRSLLDSATLK